MLASTSVARTDTLTRGRAGNQTDGMTRLIPMPSRAALLVLVALFSTSLRAGSAAILRVDPTNALVDTPVRITVSGLKADQIVRITATSRTTTDRALISYGVFRADSSGGIDVSAAKPLEGTYAQADPMGLFWSMTPQPVPADLWDHLRLEPFRPPDTWNILVEVAPEQGGRALAKAQIVRRYVAPGVRCTDVHDDGIVGRFCLPAHAERSNRVPGIIVLGGSEGGFDDTGAALFASHGYSALSLAYFKGPGLPAELLNVPLEYFIRGVDWLRSRSEIDPDRIALVGRSRGTEMALMTASIRPDIKAVVAIGPSSVFWGGISRAPGPEHLAAWSYQGKPLPFLSTDAPANLVADFFAKGPLQSQLYDFLFSDRSAVDAASIPIEKIRGRVLLISGKDDRVWGSPIMAQQIMDRARQFNRADSFVNLSYDAAGHNIREPYRPTPPQARLGGTTSGHAQAEKDSWQRILEFLEQNLRGSGGS
jgi:pimeloyl-ACP methyl ester carboxylesterase